MRTTFDYAVIGAGVFGAWTAHHLRRSGSVVLVDAHGPANSRASSGGESRIIRMGYGPDDLYTRFSARALQLWQEFFERIQKPLFNRTGVLWLAADSDRYTSESMKTIERTGLPLERLSPAELQRRYPQFALDGISWALLEPDSGVLMARQAVQALVDDAIRSGIIYLHEAVERPMGKSRLESVMTRTSATISAGTYVFACGPWLREMFPDLLCTRLFITRQEVYFFGIPAGNTLFESSAMPTWICIADQAYGMPDLEGRGLKIAFDCHGPEFDPEKGLRTVSPEGLRAVTEYLGRRFPQMANAPVIETRVCQYENTSNGDFLIDRHPDYENVWIVGGGSGHGFKHGPVVGEYAADLITGGGREELRFTLSTKNTIQSRAVF